MSSIAFYRSVKTSWDANNLGDSFPGGIHFRRAPSTGARMPYVTFSPIDNTLDGFTSHTRTDNHDFQLSIFYREDGSTDYVETLGDLMVVIDEWIRDNVFSPAAGKILSAYRTRDDILQDPDTEKVWQGQQDFRCRHVVSESYGLL